MPSLKDVRADYCWYGQFAMTFDWLPHLGTDPATGIHYLIGLVGTGVPASGYLGWKLANRILGNPEGETVFADRPFPSRPFYNGNPAWVLPAAREYYRFKDLRAWKKALAKSSHAR
jgi:glycine/D-amino acid oxidase-like deaminating enzyme